MATTSLLAQSVPLLLWFTAVNRVVSDPYLDEVFHVRQAQHYLRGRFDIWDAKITTPPGVYLLSYAVSPLLGDSLTALRALAAICLAAIPPVIFWTYTQRRRAGKQDEVVARHSALNISLLPPLFFFSSLYYTDVASTLSVLLFYSHFLRSRGSRATWASSLRLVLLGLIALAFRQTNIFWVAIFPAALELVRQLDQGHDVVRDSMHRRVEGFGDSLISVSKTSWKMDVVFDPSVRDAWFEDYFKTLISLSVCACKTLTEPKRVTTLLLALSPYLTILAAFAAFVVWNGGVVLGDKSNHIATLHLSQMLYIWPYFTFFSWPLVYPYLSALPLGLLAKLSQIAPLESMLIFKRRRLVPRPWTFLLFGAVACLVVRLNTIVHPFILADNRHYVFYVFRLLTRRWWVRYAVTPIYVICGWVCIQALGARPFNVTREQSTTSKGESALKDETRDSPRRIPDGTNSATTTFVLVWLATTSLQLVTAPLVEPRYLILPWIFWRMHLPLQQYLPADGRDKSALKPSRFAALDHRVWLESAWFLLVNAVTGYIFLKWEFSWPQEPGQVQRFMW